MQLTFADLIVILCNFRMSYRELLELTKDEKNQDNIVDAIRDLLSDIAVVEVSVPSRVEEVQVEFFETKISMEY
jgi:hypothetical protein